MGRPATVIVLTADDRATLTQRLRAPTSEQRVVVRARIVLAAADGESTDRIAEQLALRAATVEQPYDSLDLMPTLLELTGEAANGSPGATLIQKGFRQFAGRVIRELFTD